MPPPIKTLSRTRRKASDEGVLSSIEDDDVFRAVVADGPVKTSWSITTWSNAWRNKTFSRMVEQHGISRDEFNVLACLGTYGALRAKTICDVTARPKNSISRAVTLLTGKKLISQRTDAEDRRNTRLAISAEGRRMLARLFPIAFELQQKMLDVLDEKERRQLDQILDKLMHHRQSWLS